MGKDLIKKDDNTAFILKDYGRTGKNYLTNAMRRGG